MNRFFMTFLFACLSVYASAPEPTPNGTTEHRIGHPPQLEVLVQDMYQYTGWQNLGSCYYGSSPIGNGQVLEMQRVLEPYVPQYSTEMGHDGLWTLTELSFSEDLDEMASQNDPLFPDWRLYSHGVIPTHDGPLRQRVYYRVR
ncbi:MAG: hypothetical protein NEHIOOID_00444 [Holosporales bacterium]